MSHLYASCDIKQTLNNNGWIRRLQEIYLQALIQGFCTNFHLYRLLSTLLDFFKAVLNWNGFQEEKSTSISNYFNILNYIAVLCKSASDMVPVYFLLFIFQCIRHATTPSPFTAYSTSECMRLFMLSVELNLIDNTRKTKEQICLCKDYFKLARSN